MPGRIDVEGSRELRAVITGLKAVPKETSAQVRKVTKARLQPEFQQIMAERAAMTSQPRMVSAVLVRTARISVSDQNVKYQSAHIGRPLRGGLDPKVNGRVVEMGAKRPVPTRYYRKSKKGGRHIVTRNAMAQLPDYRKKGHVFWPTVSELNPRFAALWAQTALRSIHEAFERKR